MANLFLCPGNGFVLIYIIFIYIICAWTVGIYIIVCVLSECPRMIASECALNCFHQDSVPYRFLDYYYYYYDYYYYYGSLGVKSQLSIYVVLSRLILCI